MSEKHHCQRCDVKFPCALDGCKLPEEIICDVCYSHNSRNINYMLGNKGVTGL